MAETSSGSGIFCADNLEFSTYTVTETTVPPGYTGGAPVIGIVVNSKSDCSNATTRTPAATFVDNPVPGTINIVKTDDATPANALNGAVFTLYRDAGTIGGSFEPGTDDQNAVDICTTTGTGANAGRCSFTNVPLGNYWVVETTTPAGYNTAAPQHATIVLERRRTRFCQNS